MTNRKLKGYVKPTLFVISICVIMISLMFIPKNLKPADALDEAYVMNSLIESVTPVVNTSQTTISKPYTSDKVSINKSFYDKDGSEEEQRNSLIYYENTYLQNSGVVYASNEEFDVVASLDGTVIDVKEDEILNTVVYVSHNTNLTTIYYGLKDVKVKINDTIAGGDVLGKSNNNKFCTEENSMLFEVNYNGQVLNPENFYSMNIDELN